jgi:hypothetical protein
MAKRKPQAGACSVCGCAVIRPVDPPRDGEYFGEDGRHYYDDGRLVLVHCDSHRDRSNDWDVWCR